MRRSIDSTIREGTILAFGVGSSFFGYQTESCYLASSESYSWMA